MDKLPKCDANYVPLSPLTFLERAASVYADRASVVYRNTCFTWKQTSDRCRRLASVLTSLGVSKNDVVSVIAPNVPAMYEMHFGVPMAGAVLNTINTRLDPKNVALILSHSEARVLFVDHQFVPLARDALNQLGSSQPLVVVIDDVDTPTGVRLGELEYERLLTGVDPAGFVTRPVDDEWDPIALNYTSGTTSAPKGVVYSHRGAYLSTMSLLLHWEVGSEPVYLWSLPMFHCNGWTFTWGMAARGGTNVCIRTTSADEMYRAMSQHRVTHIGPSSERRPIARPVHVLTGGAPPPAPLVEKMERLGFRVTHAYGLTEATGPALVCEWQTKWDGLPQTERSRLKARQGISVLTLADVDVIDPETMQGVPRDGRSVGEIALRGSGVMKGYYKDVEATSKAFRGGWFFTGDVAVVHPDGYVEIKDRSKDVIISGGENISSVEVEAVLYGHPKVGEAAVVAMPHAHWGEVPCAFVVVKGEGGVKEGEIIGYCRDNMPHYMVPKKVVFVEELAKTSTGKVQKFQLRELAKAIAKQVKPRQENHRRKERRDLPVLAMSRL
ncbi:Butyrate--CoA ligase AAE11, peroxisomal [Acorus calamus]|uniref:4-coumarate--CoA ligase n=1 Tax=Acorus calamus TaxID=4465 RepID=A0AAV9FLV9_ACOCL|nr:Butyrate--CoA ligase AAE11, peroxisomal [Acorus calamus]